MKDQIQSAQIVVPCKRFTETLEFFTETLGFRLEMIFPADAPSTAVIAGYGITLRLEESDEKQPLTLRLFGEFAVSGEIFSPDGVRIILSRAELVREIPAGTNEFVLSIPENENLWHEGRAGMQYRDLIPSRLGGRFIASHIRIEDGGEVPDYVHYHKIRFQMIYCLSGWARLVYEDQGAPFLMNAGDCVLQPPEIRHRVLETSDRFEVLEIGCPAIHETFADHELGLPNNKLAPERIFGGQRFIHHAADQSEWQASEFKGFEERDTEILKATGGLADVRLLRAAADSNFSVRHTGEFLFFFVLSGNLNLSGGAGQNYHLTAGSSFVLPAGIKYSVEAEKGLRLLRIAVGSSEQ